MYFMGPQGSFEPRLSNVEQKLSDFTVQVGRDMNRMGGQIATVTGNSNAAKNNADFAMSVATNANDAVQALAIQFQQFQMAVLTRLNALEAEVRRRTR